MATLGERKIITIWWFFLPSGETLPLILLWPLIVFMIKANRHTAWGFRSPCEGPKTPSERKMTLYWLDHEKGRSAPKVQDQVTKNKSDELHQEVHQPKTTEHVKLVQKSQKPLKQSSRIQTQISRLLGNIALTRPSIFLPSPHCCCMTLQAVSVILYSWPCDS